MSKGVGVVHLIRVISIGPWWSISNCFAIIFFSLSFSSSSSSIPSSCHNYPTFLLFLIPFFLSNHKGDLRRSCVYACITVLELENFSIHIAPQVTMPNKKPTMSNLNRELITTGTYTKCHMNHQQNLSKTPWLNENPIIIFPKLTKTPKFLPNNT